MSAVTKLLNVLRERLNAEELGLWFALAYIAERDAEGADTRMTDLVQKLEFGTGPTVLSKVRELCHLGLIEVVRSPSDGRAKRLAITKLGRQSIADLNALVMEVLA